MELPWSSVNTQQWLAGNDTHGGCELRRLAQWLPACLLELYNHGFWELASEAAHTDGLGSGRTGRLRALYRSNCWWQGKPRSYTEVLFLVSSSFLGCGLSAGLDATTDKAEDVFSRKAHL